MSNILYIPGLGDDESISRQRRYVKFVNLFKGSGNHFHFFDPMWETDEGYDEKYSRLGDFYEHLGRPKKIVAISAGASLAIRLSVEYPEIKYCHLICPKVTGSDSIGENYQQRAPAFVESVQRSETYVAQDINASIFTCYIPKDDADQVIASADMLVPGAEVIDLPRLKHAYAIGYSLFRYVPRIK